VLPSRPRLQAWNPDSLAPAAAALDNAGVSAYDAVRGLDDGIHRMPESHAWSGRSHDAATDMFGRATDQTSTLKNYTEAVAVALSAGSGSIGSTRAALLSHADDVDKGEFSVNDQWAVLIRPARVSAEKAASLQAQAQTEQKEINNLLVAVGEADNGTAAKVQAGGTSSQPSRMTTTTRTAK
jgi:hypothetical protein